VGFSREIGNLVDYLSQEWLELGKQAINENAEFRKFAEGMNLTIIHVITNIPNRDTIYFWSTFRDGECVEVDLGEKAEGDFTLIAPFSIWKQIHEGSLDLIQAVLEKKLAVEGKPVKGVRVLKLVPLMNQIISGLETNFDI
jgi:hypothetical protein